MIKYLVYPDYYEYDGDGHYYHTDGGYRPVAALDSLEEVPKLIKKLTLEELMNIGEDITCYFDDWEEPGELIRTVFGEREELEHPWGTDFPAIEDVTDMEWRRLYEYVTKRISFFSYWEMEI
jgi:hypothetical protein